MVNWTHTFQGGMPPSILLLLSEKDPVMLTNRQIEYYAKDAGRVAYAVLGLDCDYSISLIDDPTIPQYNVNDTRGRIFT